MSRWREVARQRLATETGYANSAISADSSIIGPNGTNGANGANGTGPTTTFQTKITLTTPKAWRSALGTLSPSCPLGCMAMGRWRMLLADAQWLAREHGDLAAKLGWTASDLFGLHSYAGWGGVADRLQGARDLRFDERFVDWFGGEYDWCRLIRVAPNGRVALNCGPPLWDLVCN